MPEHGFEQRFNSSFLVLQRHICWLKPTELISMKVMIQFSDMSPCGIFARCSMNGDYNPLSRLSEAFVAGFCCVVLTDVSFILYVEIPLLASLF